MQAKQVFYFRDRCQIWLSRRRRTSANGTVGRTFQERLPIPAMPWKDLCSE